jgi:signal transduction histidine kinase
VVLCASRQPDFWCEQDAAFMQSVARWIGMLTQRTELIQDASRNAVEQGRRDVADELVTVLAHDLRNYLAPLDWRLRVVRRRAERDGRGADVGDLDTTLRGLERLGSLISDLLDVARVDQGVFSIDVQPLPLLALLEDTAVTLETPEHPIAVEAAEEVLVLADPMRIRQCVENLLANAIKHSPRHGKVRVVLSRQRQQEGEWAAIDVIDEGAGVPEHMLPTLFDRYVKGAKSIGLGLGLYLAKRIVVMHGGELSVEPKPGPGAQFRLTLPIHAD